MIKSGLRDLKEEINKMSDDEKRIEQPDEIENIAEKIIEFNDKTNKDED